MVLSFMGAPTGMTPTDPGFQRVEELLAGLEFPQPQAPAAPGPVRTIFGSIGDALLAAATVKAGGTPPAIGPFAAGIRQRQMAFEEQKAEADAASRDLRNRIRISAAESAQEERRVRIRAQADVDQARINATSDVEKERLKVENDVRKGFIDRIVDLGIDTKGKDLLTASTGDLKAIIDAHDPAESVNTVLKSLPPGMSLSKISMNKDGTLSFETKAPGADKDEELPVGIITTLIQAGEDPSAFIKDPNLAGAAKRAAEGSAKKALAKQADAFLEDVTRVANQNDIKPDGTADVVNMGIASAAMDLRAMKSPEEATAFYQKEVSLAAEMVKANEMNEAEAADYITRLRQLVRYKFPDASLEMPRHGATRSWEEDQRPPQPAKTEGAP